jgi:hypothetical protein
MFLKCLCGNVMNDIAAPNGVEHILLSYSAKERLEHLVHKEVSSDCTVDMWPEHWEESGAIDVWKCPDCGRLYFNAKGNTDDVIVYKIEKKRISKENRNP